MEQRKRAAAKQRSSHPVQTQIVESPRQNRLPPPQNYESSPPLTRQEYESRNPPLTHQEYESRNPPFRTQESRTLPPTQTTFPRTAPYHPRNVNRQRYSSGSSYDWNYATGREDDV